MSRSHFIFRDVPMDAWVDRYKKSHQRRINRVVQTFGIPMIAVSIPLFLIAPLVRGFWKIPLSLFTAALGFLVDWQITKGEDPRNPHKQPRVCFPTFLWQRMHGVGVEKKMIRPQHYTDLHA